MLTYIVVAIIAYCLGSISFSVIISKKMAGFDVREKGSKNAGSTNVLRTVGKKAAAITLVCDILKGVISVLIAYAIGNIVNGVDIALLVQLAGIFAVVGHTFPVFFKFKGGKGVATALGVILVVNWQIGLICLVFAILIMALTKIVSLGSMGAAILFPVLTLFIHTNYIVPGSYIIFGIILAVFIVYNHRANIKRLANGTENKLGNKK
ncbi:MAG: glycerol-3-phosphate 1-O-acyltransferase PlsY [Clostridia bacterium]|nr:glycerol-3-phosphate 1-O-acyltransferase PlsY [Clostridia bacterium]